MSLLLLVVILLMGLLVVALFVIAALLDRPWSTPYRQPVRSLPPGTRVPGNKAA